MDSPSSGNVDEAQEKLFGDSNSSGSKIEIKFVADPKNGDTKIDISEVRQAFVGMGKEELMRFANDPFYVRMRWLLFILFWALWFGMLAGAVAIILLAPKCSAPEKSIWYKESPIYHINVKNFKDSTGDGIGDLIGLESKLDYIKSLGAETILLDSIMKTDNESDNVIDFKQINPQYGTFDDLKKLIASAKEKGLHLLMKIVPNFSSIKHDWFNQSANGIEPFKDYYVWTDPKNNKDGNPEPINNWINIQGESAWTFNENRKQFYLHQFNNTQPDLNFRNVNLVKYFNDVFSFWLGQGFDGLYLDKVKHLVEDKDFTNEEPSSLKPSTLGEYEFLTHSRTTNLQDSWDILKEWATGFKSQSKVLAVSGVPDDLNIANVVFEPIRVKSSMKAMDIKSMLLNRLSKSKTPKALGFSCDDCDERLLTDLQAVLLMLPGSTIITSGLELGLPIGSIFQFDSSEKHGFTSGEPWKSFSKGFTNRGVSTEINNATSHFSVFQKIIKERPIPTILEGTTDIEHQDSVLSILRKKDNNPSYLVLWNLDKVNKTFDLHEYFKDQVIKFTLLTEDNSGSVAAKELSSDKMVVSVPGSSLLIYKSIN